jgi:hypothetical protein
MVAWLLGISWTLLPSPWVDQSTPPGLLILIYGIAGLGMAASVSVITGLGLIWLLQPIDIARSTSLVGTKRAQDMASLDAMSELRKKGELL